MGQPQCLALVVCDQVIEDRRTGNKTLVGLFNIIAVGALPTTHRLFLMASVTGMDRPVPLTIKLVPPQGPPVELTLEPGEKAKTQPQVVHDLVFDFRGLVLTHEGDYAIQLCHEDVVLASRHFSVRLLKTDTTKPIAQG